LLEPSFFTKTHLAPSVLRLPGKQQTLQTLLCWRLSSSVSMASFQRAASGEAIASLKVVGVTLFSLLNSPSSRCFASAFPSNISKQRVRPGE
ncbi:hypothetical protein VP01_8217g1, partial [Puccinia sorghi]